MEKNINAIVLDFFGLPGSGKTTLSHLLCEILEEKGKKVIEPSYMLDHDNHMIKRKIKKLVIAFSYFLGNPNETIRIMRYIKNNNYSTNSYSSNVVDILCKLYFVKQYSCHYDYIVFDEGFVQAAITLNLYNKTESVLSSLNVITEQIYTKSDVVLIYVPCEIKESLRRVIDRGSNDTSVERLRNNKEQVDYLIRFNESIQQVIAEDERRIFPVYNYDKWQEILR